MNYLDLLEKIFQVCIIPLLGILCNFLIEYIKIKKTELVTQTDNELAKKYMDLLANTIETCVIATNQTYVDALKDKNAFDAAAQREAFKKTYEAVFAILTEEAQMYLSNAVGDLELYIKQQIEATVNANKYYPIIIPEPTPEEPEPIPED